MVLQEKKTKPKQFIKEGRLGKLKKLVCLVCLSANDLSHRKCEGGNQNKEG